MSVMNKIKSIIKRAVVSLIFDDGDNYTRVQVTYNGKTKTVRLLSPYGLYSIPPVNSLATTWNILGSEEDMDAIATDETNRFKNKKEGEVVLGNTKTGTKIYLKENGDIDIEGAANINIDSTGNVVLNAGSEPLVRGTAFQTLYNAHVHSGPGTPPTILMTATQLSTKNFTE